jgi:hypothetical protein
MIISCMNRLVTRWLLVLLLVGSALIYMTALLAAPFGAIVVLAPLWSLAAFVLLRVAGRALANAGAPLRRLSWWVPPAAIAATIGDGFAASLPTPMALPIVLTTFLVVTPTVVALIGAVLVYLGDAPGAAGVRVVRTAPLTWVVAMVVGGVALRDRVAVEVTGVRPANDAWAMRHAGCYALTVNSWWPPRQPGHGFRDSMPAVVRLDTLRGRDANLSDAARAHMWFIHERDHFLMRPGWRYGGAYWLPVDASGVSLRWNNGFHGVTLNLRRRGSGYRGVATAHTDVMTSAPSPRASMIAEPVGCVLVRDDSIREPSP